MRFLEEAKANCFGKTPPQFEPQKSLTEKNLMNSELKQNSAISESANTTTNSKIKNPQNLRRQNGNLKENVKYVKMIKIRKGNQNSKNKKPCKKNIQT